MYKVSLLEAHYRQTARGGILVFSSLLFSVGENNCLEPRQRWKSMFLQPISKSELNRL